MQTKEDDWRLKIDPQEAEKQFEKDQIKQRKVQELKTSVFRNFTIKKSKSVMHPIVRPSNEDTPNTKPSQSDKNCLSIEPQTNTNIKDICFVYSQRSKSVALKPMKPTKVISIFSSQRINFSPRKTGLQMEQKMPAIQMNPENRIKRSLSTKIKAMEHRDSQTLLRKNSLFLVNCLKTRYRQNHKKAHIGETPAVNNIKLGFFSEKNAGVTHYQQRFEYMEEARQRLMMARTLEVQSKVSRLSSLLPQPW